MKSRKSFGVEVNKLYEGLLADHAEFWFLIGAHPTVLATTPDTLLQITATFDEAGLSFFDQMLPLDESCCFGGQVGFPRFCVVKIHRIVIAIGVLITQSTERMAEFVHHDRQEVLTTRITEIIGIVYAASAIVLCIH